MPFIKLAEHTTYIDRNGVTHAPGSVLNVSEEDAKALQNSSEVVPEEE